MLCRSLRGAWRPRSERLDKEIDQIALTYTFKSAVPNPADIFDASFLPAAAERKLD
jgi:NitT/TauT family transport system substrate-binding protein